MSQASLEEAVPAGRDVLLDTSTIISYLNAGEPTSGLAAHLIDSWVAARRNAAVISMVSVTELLARPYRRGGHETGIVEAFLRHFPNVRLVDICYEIADRAAQIRATANLKAPDALIVATALVERVGVVVTNDARWAARLGTADSGLLVCRLDAHLPFP